MLVNNHKFSGRGASPVFPANQTIIPITVTYANAPSTYAVSKATFKYDKDIAYSMTFDDGLITAYSNVFKVLHGGVAEDGNTYTGFKYTDGCGNDKFFSAAAAWYTVNSSGSDLHVSTPSNISYPQATEMWDAGWDFINHSWSHANGSGNTPGFGGLGHPNYSYEIATTPTTFFTNTGRKMGKQLVIPAGDPNYITPATTMGMVAIYNQGGSGFLGGSTGLRMDNLSLSAPHKMIRQLKDSASVDGSNIMNELTNTANLATGGAKYWYNDFTHVVSSTQTGASLVFSTWLTYMTNIYNTYAKGGTDNIWVAPLQEVFEYTKVKQNATVSSPILIGNSTVFEIAHSFTNTDLRRFSLTLKVNSDQDISSITVPSGYTATFRGTGSNRIINIEKDVF